MTSFLASWAVMLLCSLTLKASAFGLGNLCTTSYGTDCCPGWRRDAANLCSIPVCDGDCGPEGHCVGPNLCYCSDGVVQYSCAGGHGTGGNADCPRPCQNGGQCRSGRCDCPSGFSGTLCQFAACPSFCSGHGQCLPTGVCSCSEGFSGPACDVVDKGPCYSGVTASGGCAGKLTSVFISREECCNSFGKAWGVACRSCQRSGCGFGRVSQGRACVKLNFCDIAGVCGSDVCIPDGDGDIACLCSPGLTYNPAERRCERQRSFCDSNLGVCGVGGSCVNTDDAAAATDNYRCQCFPGYDLRADGKYCTERAPDPCSARPGVCGIGGVCVSVGRAGDFRCRCDAGYESGDADGRSCRRLTYCSVNPTTCGFGGDCVPVDDFYYCRCRPGYQATASGLDCLPTTTAPPSWLRATTTTAAPPPDDICSRQLTCLAEAGECLALSSDEFLCVCRTGYRQSDELSRSCAPDRPLADAPAGGAGGGGGGSAGRGVDDPCAPSRSRCANGSCQRLSDNATSTAGGAAPTYRCLCNPGFEPSDPSKPQDCRARRLYCDGRPSTCANGRCVSVSATDFYCECQRGFRQADDRRSCLSESAESEINPCQVFDICRNGACLNLGSGAFQCLCYKGFELTGDRQNCRLQAPPRYYCERNPRTCAPNGTCASRGQTDYVCTCKPGFQSGPGQRSCQRKPPKRQQSTIAAAAAATPRTPRLPPTAEPAQPTGFPAPSDPLQRLFHKSYCQKFSYVCGRGHCLDLDGSHQFTCSCAAGYRLSHDKRYCVKADLRETGYCAEHPNACAGSGHCVNSPGTQLYQCFCYPGFRNVDAERRRCQPYDYNADTNKVVIHGLNSGGGDASSGRGGGGGGGGGGGSSGGYAHLGSPDAVAASTFGMDGRITEIAASAAGGGSSKRRDVEYASLGSSGSACHTLETGPGRSGLCQHGWCTDRGIDFECSCGFGFRQAPDKKSCVDIDECVSAGSDICLMGRCINTVGSYTCDCRPGFQLDAGNKLCRDRNECAENPGICANGDCQNLWGSYECRCRPGYRPSNASRLACEPAGAVSDFSIDGAVSVHHAECPDCLGGCRLDRPDRCLCPAMHKLLGDIVCVPLSSKPSGPADRAAGLIRVHLPSGAGPDNVHSARRRVRITGCSVVSRSAWYSLTQCSFIETPLG